MKYKKLYDENQDFHDYVDRYVRSKGISIHDALLHKIVREVGDYYANGGERS